MMSNLYRLWFWDHDIHNFKKLHNFLWILHFLIYARAWAKKFRASKPWEGANTTLFAATDDVQWSMESYKTCHSWQWKDWKDNYAPCSKKDPSWSAGMYCFFPLPFFNATFSAKKLWEPLFSFAIGQIELYKFNLVVNIWCHMQAQICFPTQ